MFKIWTLKEAYTKALGQGLGFDFRRVQYNEVLSEVKIDGQDPDGWEFIQCILPHEAHSGADRADYLLTVARFTGKQGVQFKVLPSQDSSAICSYSIQSLMEIVLG